MFYLARRAFPDIHGRNSLAQRVPASAQDLDCIGGLYSRDRGCDASQDTRGFAGRLRPLRRVRVHTAQTRRFPRQNGHRDTVAADRRTVDPWNAAADRIIIQQVTRLEVVRSIQDEIRARQQSPDIGRCEIAHNPVDTCANVDRGKTLCRGGSLGERFGGISFFEEPLALEVAWLDVIAVYNDQPAYTGASQGCCLEAAQRTAAHDGRARLQKALLALFLNSWKRI